MKDFYVSAFEIKAIRRRLDRRDARRIASVLNRVCKVLRIGAHYDVRHSRSGFCVKCSFDRIRQLETGLMSMTKRFIGEEKSMCAYLFKELNRYVPVSQLQPR